MSTESKPRENLLGRAAEKQLSPPLLLLPSAHGTGLELHHLGAPFQPRLFHDFTILKAAPLQDQSSHDTWLLTPVPFSSPEDAEMY